MVPVTIETLVVGIPPSPSVVVLRPLGDSDSGARVMPIWIGPAEAAAIGLALEGQPRLRPMTHDFLFNIINALHAEIDHVVIDRVDGSTFFATVSLKQDGRHIPVDARPSDSIALALRARVPLYVEKSVLDASSFPYVLMQGTASKDATVEQFRSFLDSVSPEDFEVRRGGAE
ncbi:MAG: bifunctional nuclease family protein [Coriobacteriales bacterium]|jgi:bifunctional DNase/RNase|nr:bifunctional nuclease family protein [Coriobacteriales bacterium]